MADSVGVLSSYSTTLYYNKGIWFYTGRDHCEVDQRQTESETLLSSKVVTLKSLLRLGQAMLAPDWPSHGKECRKG